MVLMLLLCRPLLQLSFYFCPSDVVIMVALKTLLVSKRMCDVHSSSSSPLGTNVVHVGQPVVGGGQGGKLFGPDPRLAIATWLLYSVWLVGLVVVVVAR